MSLWTITDSRDGKRTTVAAFHTKEQAERQIARTRADVANGRRCDLDHVAPYLTATLKSPLDNGVE